jgi:hypothetical protein
MLRKILVTAAVALAGLVAFGGAASADTGYGADPVTTPTLGISGGGAAGTADDPIPLGAPFVLGLTGFTPGETIDVVGSLDPADRGNPPGLRRARAFALLSSGLNFTTQADGAGNGALTVSYDEPGTYTFVATGRTSGISNSVSVVVGAAGGSLGAGGTGSGGSSGTGDSAGTAGDANGSNGSAASGSDSGLAYTGASIAGPLAIGLGALLAGLALLFFGTRGLIRRKTSHPGL